MTAEQLRNSILQEAISGRLVPQDPNDEPVTALIAKIADERQHSVKGKKAKDVALSSISDEVYPYDIPSSWALLRISDLCYITNGFTPLRTEPRFWTNGSISWFTVEDIRKQGEIINYTAQKITPAATSQERIVRAGSTLLCCTASVGQCAITNIPLTTNQQFNALTIKEWFMPIVDDKYLYWYAKTLAPTLHSLAGQTTFEFVSVKKVGSILIPLPPLAEQKRIVAKLEELLPIVEQYGKAQKELDELNTALPARLRQSILQEAISGRLVPQDPNEIAEDVKATEIEDEPFEIPNNWRWCLLGDLIDMVSGTSYKKGDVCTNGVRILRGGNIVNDELVLAEDDVFLPNEYENIEKNIRKDDIIIVASTGSQKVIGKPALIRQNYDRTQIGAFLRIIRAKDAKYVPYLWLVFKGLYYREHIRNLVKGTNINNIKEEYITALPIPLPPLAEQQRIVAKIEELLADINKISK